MYTRRRTPRVEDGNNKQNMLSHIKHSIITLCVFVYTIMLHDKRTRYYHYYYCVLGALFQIVVTRSDVYYSTCTSSQRSRVKGKGERGGDVLINVSFEIAFAYIL